MQAKLSPPNFFLSSVFYFLLFLVPFTVIRLYFYFNYYFATQDFVLSDFFWLNVTGWRFDLCVIGFLLMPVYVLYLFSYWLQVRKICYWIANFYKVIVVMWIMMVFHFNIPFLATNVSFDLVQWMHWPDYVGLTENGCDNCYWAYNYLAVWHPLQTVSILMWFLIIFSGFAHWTYFSDKFNLKRELLFFVLLGLMARGKVGHHHLRYEDSLWHKEPLLNSLSNNPLWLMDKPKN